MRLKPVAPFLMLQALRDTAIADVRVPGGHAGLGRPAQRQPARGLLRRRRRASIPSAGSSGRAAPSATSAQPRRRCRSAPARASARAGSWRCSRSRWRWRCCSAASRSRASRAAGGGEPDELHVVHDDAVGADDAPARARAADRAGLAPVERGERLQAVGDQVVDRPRGRARSAPACRCRRGAPRSSARS